MVFEIDEEIRRRVVAKILLPKGEKPPERVMILSTDISDKRITLPIMGKNNAT